MKQEKKRKKDRRMEGKPYTGEDRSSTGVKNEITGGENKKLRDQETKAPHQFPLLLQPPSLNPQSPPLPPPSSS